MNAPSWLSVRGPDLLLRVRVQPRARSEGVAGLHAGRLRLRISAPPADGRANARLVQWLAEILGMPANDIQLLRGHGSRDKDVLLRGAAHRLVALKEALTRGENSV